MGLADGCKIVVGSRTSYKNVVIISDPAMFVKVHKFHSYCPRGSMISCVHSPLFRRSNSTTNTRVMSWALRLPQSLAFLPLKYSCPNVEKRLDYGFTYSFTRMPNTVLRSKRWTPTVGFTPRFTWTLICSENSTLFPGSGRLAGDFRRSTTMLTALTHSTISGFHFSSYCRCVTNNTIMKCGSYTNWFLKYLRICSVSLQTTPLPIYDAQKLFQLNYASPFYSDMFMGSGRTEEISIGRLAKKGTFHSNKLLLDDFGCKVL